MTEDARVHGPEILARTMSRATKIGKSGEWQYHSRSDRHSKVACWAIIFDLLQKCPAIADHARSRELAFGINHEMRDFKSDRKKDLDLVLCTVRGTLDPTHHGVTWKDLRSEYEVILTDRESRTLNGLPDIVRAPVGTVRVALEAKACMTAHVKALPRFFDELNSSHATIHGNSDAAVAVGLALVNSASTFISPGMNTGVTRNRISKHKQPSDTVRVVEKVKQIPRRTAANEDGYDAFGITIVECRNDGSPVTVVTEPPAPQPGDSLHYESMIDRVCQTYATRFARA